MNVQEVIHDALALAGVTADGLDAGDPDPQYQARALSCLRMLLGDWGTQLKLNNSQRTYVVSPQRLDMISVGLNDVPVQSTVELYTVPADGLLQLPVTNIAKPATPTIVVQNLATRIPYQVIVAGTPTAGQVLVNAILAKPHGLLPACTVLNKPRLKAVEKALPTVRQLCLRLFGNERVTPRFWQLYFETAEADDFHAGRQPGGPGHENWQPDFEYLLRETVIAKLADRALSEVVS